MIWRKLLSLYGLQRPYKLDVAIIFLTSVAAIFVTVSLGAILYAKGLVEFGTDRGTFFVYTLSALLVAAASSRRTLFSSALLAWCAIEIGLFVGSLALQAAGITIPILPSNYYTRPFDYGLEYHPLLQAVPRANWHGINRFDIRDERLHPDWRLNWSALRGRDLEFKHNAYGVRGDQLRPADLQKPLIFAYGGSTTYDVTVTQGQTWVEQLGRDLHDNFTVINFGVVGYSTTENLVQTAFYEKKFGKFPVCAIYYVGANDIHNAHIPNLDLAYARWHLLVQSRYIRKSELWGARYSPLIRAFDGILQSRFDSIPPPRTLLGDRLGTGRDIALEHIFVQHIDTITAINNSRGIKTIYIGQLLNRAYFEDQPNASNGWNALVRNKDVWPLQRRFNSLLRRAAASKGAEYIGLDVDDFGVADFIDYYHFSAAGSEKFANLIANRIGSYCERASGAEGPDLPPAR